MDMCSRAVGYLWGVDLLHGKLKIIGFIFLYAQLTSAI
jgi:hypothetical protein